VSDPGYSFRIGRISCRAVADGTVGTAPASIMFAQPPEQLLRRALEDHHVEPQHIPFSWTCLVIFTDGRYVLVDSGSGAGGGPTVGLLLSNLLAAGIAPTDIEMVVLSHGHPDHIGGTLDRDGKRTFRNARHVMLKDEWEFWTADPDLHELPIPVAERESLRRRAQNTLAMLRDHIDLVRGAAEILPGIEVIPAPGHTPGSLAVRVSSGHDQLLVIGDAVYHPIHIEQPDWYSVYDYEPAMATATRRRLFEEAARTGGLVLAYHILFPGLGHVTSNGPGWRWEPVQL
jgi:glyoxylase-like metal-dependent hydrolase (beta-lactamase superfamily II)